MRRDRDLFNLERRYVGKHVKYYESELPKRGGRELPKFGPYYGVVLMLTNSEAEAIHLGEKTYGFTGNMLIRPDDGAPDVEIGINDIYIIPER